MSQPNGVIMNSIEKDLAMTDAQRREELRRIMSHYRLNTHQVAELIGCAAGSVSIWRSDSAKTISPFNLMLLRTRAAEQMTIEAMAA